MPLTIRIVRSDGCEDSAVDRCSMLNGPSEIDRPTLEADYTWGPDNTSLGGTREPRPGETTLFDYRACSTIFQGIITKAKYTSILVYTN